MGRIDWSNRGWARVIVWTVLGTLGSMAVAVFADSFNFPSYSPDQMVRALLTDILVPLVLAGPLLALFTSKVRQLAIAHQQMSILATTDSLTTVLNRGAFTMLVDAYLNQSRARDEAPTGALLVVDADHFKSINDAFGHDNGDLALREIAASIKGVLRGADIVGRMGGEEFGVFLPGADERQAAIVAERVRAAVDGTNFAPEGVRAPLTVSVGGATFRRAIGFSELYRIADKRLYAAKEAGRNRISLAPADLALAA